MSMLNELRNLQEQMVNELTQVPLYRALKALDRFITEIEQIYQEPSEPARTLDVAEKVAQAVEARMKAHESPAPQPNAPKVTPYIPTQRVA